MWTAVTRSVSCPSNQETKETEETKNHRTKETKKPRYKETQKHRSKERNQETKNYWLKISFYTF